MTAELSAHGNLMGGVRSATKGQKLKLSKATKARLARLDEKRMNSNNPRGSEPSEDDVRTALGKGSISPAEASDLNPRGGLTPNSRDVREAYQKGKIDREQAFNLNPKADLNAGRRKPKEEQRAPIKVKPERVVREGSDRKPANSKSDEQPRGAGSTKDNLPKRITPPGPTAREQAQSKATSAAKGSKNKSTIKVAEPMVYLEEGPNFGKPVYSITDVPRQWGRNG